MADPNKVGLMFSPLMQYGTNLTKTEARVIEQTIINQFGMQKNGGQLLNKINSIAPSKWELHGIQ